MELTPENKAHVDCSRHEELSLAFANAAFKPEWRVLVSITMGEIADRFAWVDSTRSDIAGLERACIRLHGLLEYAGACQTHVGRTGPS